RLILHPYRRLSISRRACVKDTDGIQRPGRRVLEYRLHLGSKWLPCLIRRVVQRISQRTGRKPLTEPVECSQRIIQVAGVDCSTHYAPPRLLGTSHRPAFFASHRAYNPLAKSAPRQATMLPSAAEVSRLEPQAVASSTVDNPNTAEAPKRSSTRLISSPTAMPAASARHISPVSPASATSISSQVGRSASDCCTCCSVDMLAS